MGKRAQFFLLAAVIISAVVISLGITANRVVVNKEPGNFYDFSYEVKREVGAVLDYEIYTDFDDGANLTSFIKLLATDIRDKDPDANFMFLYGDDVFMELRNYGSEDAFADGGSTPGSGAGVISIICLEGGSCVGVEDIVSTFEDGAGYSTFNDIGNNLTLTVEGHDFNFPISEHRQVIFVMQKEVEDESFVTVK